MDRAEFINIVDSNKDLFFRFALRLTMHHEDAEDIVQDALLKIWRKRMSIRMDKNFIAYTLTTIKNTYIDKKRTKRDKAKIVEFDEQLNYMTQNIHDTDEQVNNAEAGKLINRFIDMLPVNLRMVIQLRDIEGYSTKETAEILEMDAGTVKVYLSRARKNIRQLLLKEYNITYEH